MRRALVFAASVGVTLGAGTACRASLECTVGEAGCKCNEGSCFGGLICTQDICLEDGETGAEDSAGDGDSGTGDGDGSSGDGDGSSGDGDGSSGDGDGTSGDGDGTSGDGDGTSGDGDGTSGDGDGTSGDGDGASGDGDGASGDGDGASGDGDGTSGDGDGTSGDGDGTSGDGDGTTGDGDGTSGDGTTGDGDGTSGDGDGTTGDGDGDGDGTGYFTAESSVLVGSVRAIAVADLATGGFPEIAVATDSDLRAYQRSPAATYSGLDPALSIASGTTDLQLGDFNGDTRADALLAFPVPGLVRYATGAGTGVFTGGINTSVGSAPNKLLLGRQPGDCDLDAVGVDASAMTVHVLESSGNGTFTASTVPGGAVAAAAAGGDFNRDGVDDVVVAGTDAVVFHAGLAAGGFAAGVTSTGPTTPVSLAAGDLNRDGRTDLLVGTPSGPVAFSGAGDGTFMALGGETPAEAAYEIALADFDGDAVLDAVSVDPASGTIVFRAGDGLGGFSVLGSNVVPGTSLLRVADLDRDGWPDVVAAGSGGGGRFVPLINPAVAQSVSLGLSVLHPTPGNRGLQVADLDRDGRADLIGGAVVGSSVTGHRNTGGIGLTSFSAVSTLTQPLAMAILDFNSDGRSDLAVSGGVADGTAVEVLAGDGAGGFTSVSSLMETMGSTASGSIGVGDRDCDGDVDVAYVRLTTSLNSEASFVENTTGSALAAAPAAQFGGGAAIVLVADMDANATPDLVGLFGGEVIVRLNNNAGNSWGSAFSYPLAGLSPTAGAVGDLNADGRPDIVVGDASGTIELFRNSAGAPNYEGAVAGTAAIEDIELADLNHDGALDLVWIDANARVGWREQTGPWTFSSAQSVASGSGGTMANGAQLVVVDFDRDGRLDVAAARVDGSLSVLVRQ